jgi:ABC-type Fe3+ transport system permease subunit
MRRLARVVGVALSCAFPFVLGLAFVFIVTTNVYVDINLTGTTSWEECDDCSFLLSSEAWFWAKIAAAVYTSACLALGAYLIRRRRRRDVAGRLGAEAERAPAVDA